jgi:hypothetical protein
MEAIVVRIGGIVRLESDPEHELANIARTTTTEELAEWLRDYDAGRWLLVRLELFAEALSDLGVRRYYDDTVHALTFGVPHGDDNIDHAREMVRSGVDSLAAMLAREGLPTDADALGRLPVAVELDAEVEARLAA